MPGNNGNVLSIVCFSVSFTLIVVNLSLQVTNICLETMEGHQRAIMGNMTVEQIYRDRQTFSTKVFEVDIYDYLIIN